jgi:formyltetrahydrofolate deformylase
VKSKVILTLSCPDKVGIVAAVTQFIATHQGNIISSSQHGEEESQTFFMRISIGKDVDQSKRI